MASSASAYTTVLLAASAFHSHAFSNQPHNALQSSHPIMRHANPFERKYRPPRTTTHPLHVSNSNNDDNRDDNSIPNDLGLEIIRGGGSDMSYEVWRDIKDGAPGKWEIMKRLLGVNIFTYILAILIAFFLSMNAIYGPGWFGQFLGMENVGTFTQVSDSLPIDVDVSGEEFLLQ